ncbi:MAG: hypothetical protein OES57_05535 [Acidimicrobiia bacterium]|nr:hypothetical protein [Acidimicrobiia bacterium]
MRDLAEGRFEPWVDPSVPIAAVRIRALVHQGRYDAARDEMGRHTIDELRSWSSLDLVSAAFAASRWARVSGATICWPSSMNDRRSGRRALSTSACRPRS